MTIAEEIFDDSLAKVPRFWQMISFWARFPVFLAGAGRRFGGLPEQSQRKGRQSSAEEVAAFQVGKMNHRFVLARAN